jgi:hypothetical protein
MSLSRIMFVLATALGAPEWVNMVVQAALSGP